MIHAISMHYKLFEIVEETYDLDSIIRRKPTLVYLARDPNSLHNYSYYIAVIVYLISWTRGRH